MENDLSIMSQAQTAAGTVTMWRGTFQILIIYGNAGAMLAFVIGTCGQQVVLESPNRVRQQAVRTPPNA